MNLKEMISLKRLYLLRHGKSSWDNIDIKDFDRPLNERGNIETKEMGKYMLKMDYIPDFIISSSAKRTRETLDNIIKEINYTGEIKILDELYLATSFEIKNQIEKIDSDSLLVIGHNPGLETLLGDLVSGYYTMKTSHLAVIDLEEKKLLEFIRPKEF